MIFRGDVTGAGGGVVDVMVDRDTASYPSLGDRVVVMDELAYAELRSAVTSLLGFHFDPGAWEHVRNRVKAALSEAEVS